MSSAARIADLADAIKNQADAGEPLLPIDMRAIVAALGAIERTLRRTQIERASQMKRAAA